MENDTLKKEADKVINVTYMLSGVLEQSFQEIILDWYRCFHCDTSFSHIVVFFPES